MANELNLGEAIRALQAEYGESFDAGLEQGQEMMARALEERLKISRQEADKVVRALIDAHTVRWQGKTANLPVEQTGVSPAGAQRAETGTWSL